MKKHSRCKEKHCPEINDAGDVFERKPPSESGGGTCSQEGQDAPDGKVQFRVFPAVETEKVVVIVEKSIFQLGKDREFGIVVQIVIFAVDSEDVPVKMQLPPPDRPCGDEESGTEFQTLFPLAADGRRSALHRCLRETHPLKYG